MTACPDCRLTAQVLAKSMGLVEGAMYADLLAERGHRHGETEHPLWEDATDER